eukprot:14887675-Alexandrium_andersonii.AAC.1
MQPQSALRIFFVSFGLFQPASGGLGRFRPPAESARNRPRPPKTADDCTTRLWAGLNCLKP